MDENIVNYPGLKRLVATAAGTDVERASEFLHAFFDIISQEIAHNESIKIKGIGTFRRAEDSNGASTVAFVPDVELADAINSPFAFFEAVELSPSVSDDDLADIGQTSQPVSPVAEAVVDTDTLPEVPVTDEHDDTEAEEVASEPGTEAQEEDQQPASDKPEAQEEDDDNLGEEQTGDSDDHPTLPPEDETNTDTDTDTEPVYESNESSSSGFGWPWLLVTLLIGLMIGFGAGYLCHDNLEARLIAPEIEETEETEASVEQTDSIAESVPDTMKLQPETPPAPTEVYDTISPTRFLTTMARRHYGQMDYWVYIYMENADRLGHPNRARPGTVVRIPPLSKYVEPDDTTALQKARRLSAEIYNKYN